MAELRFKQITDKLNEELAGENWKLIFWYEANPHLFRDVADVMGRNPSLADFLKRFLQILMNMFDPHNKMASAITC